MQFIFGAWRIISGLEPLALGRAQLRISLERSDISPRLHLSTKDLNSFIVSSAKTCQAGTQALDIQQIFVLV